jgi:hypothetical protein
MWSLVGYVQLVVGEDWRKERVSWDEMISRELVVDWRKRKQLHPGYGCDFDMINGSCEGWNEIFSD